MSPRVRQGLGVFSLPLGTALGRGGVPWVGVRVLGSLPQGPMLARESWLGGLDTILEDPWVGSWGGHQPSNSTLGSPRGEILAVSGPALPLAQTLSKF